MKCLLGLLAFWTGLGLGQPSGSAWGQSALAPSSQPVVLEFHRQLCPVCKESERQLMEVRTAYPGQFQVQRVFMDEDPTLFRRYRVDTVPTLIFLDDNGKALFRYEGLMPRDKLVAKLKELKFLRTPEK
jgi:thioredoxin-like negative regulator of GroEL